MASPPKFSLKNKIREVIRAYAEQGIDVSENVNLTVQVLRWQRSVSSGDTSNLSVEVAELTDTGPVPLVRKTESFDSVFSNTSSTSYSSHPIQGVNRDLYDLSVEFASMAGRRTPDSQRSKYNPNILYMAPTSQETG